MVRVRDSQRTVDNQELQTLKSNFIDNLDTFRLSDLSLEDLANRYVSVDKQSQLIKGLILLEARERFLSNNEFGECVKTVITLCDDSFQQRNRYMNLARYFKERDMTGISITVAYEISIPANADIADNLYQIALNQNLSVAQIKAEIVKAKGLLPESSGEPELMPLGDISSFMEHILAEIGELPVNDAMRVLDECKKQLRKNTKV